MNENNLLYLMYGICIAFHMMMGWIFCCQKRGLAKKLIGILMLVVAVQYSKDLMLLQHFYLTDPFVERLASSIDIVTVPLYVLILIEFCRPGWLTWMRAALFELPFMLLSVLYMSTRASVFFYAMLMLSVAFGVWCAVWTLRELPRYHRRLKEEYSYDEDINLHWMRGVTALFFVILLIWVVSNICATPLTDILYMSGSLVGWSVVCYFLNKQETALSEIVNGDAPPQPLGAHDVLLTSPEQPIPEATAAHEPDRKPGTSPGDIQPSLRSRIESCFDTDKIYLNPKLRLSELAIRLGTNRTYLSQFFNQNCEQSFYEYVNSYRVRHSMQLLLTTDYNLELVASMSGFNSLSTFRRAFMQANGCSPQQYRVSNQ